MNKIDREARTGFDAATVMGYAVCGVNKPGTGGTA